MKIIKLIIKELPVFGIIWSLLSILAYSQKGVKGNEPIFQDYNILKISFLFYLLFLFGEFLKYIMRKYLFPYLDKIFKINNKK